MRFDRLIYLSPLNSPAIIAPSHTPHSLTPKPPSSPTSFSVDVASTFPASPMDSSSQAPIVRSQKGKVAARHSWSDLPHEVVRSVDAPALQPSAVLTVSSFIGISPAKSPTPYGPTTSPTLSRPGERTTSVPNRSSGPPSWPRSLSSTCVTSVLSGVSHVSRRHRRHRRRSRSLTLSLNSVHGSS